MKQRQGPDTTQRSGGVSGGAECVIPLLEYQRADVESDARFRWCCWARQTGKSFTKSLRRILRGLARGRNQLFLSAGERQSRELMMKARQHCQALKIAFDYYDDRTFQGLSIKQLEIALPGGVRIIGLPANPMTARGFTGDVFLDEFAMHEHDREIWAAMFPALLRGEGELDVASTPRGRGNLFHHLRDNPDFETSVVTLAQAVAMGLDVDVEQMRRAMGDDELFRQEFLCEFLDEATAFLAHEQIARCVDPGLVLAESSEDLADEQRELFVGVDVGRVRDLTVIWVVAREYGSGQTRTPAGLQDTGGQAASGTRTSSDTGDSGTSNHLVTVAVFAFASAPFREQFEALSAVLTNRMVRKCCIDAGGIGMQLAEQAVERFGAHRVEAVQFTPAFKSQIATGLRIAVEAERIRIPDDDWIVRDWHSIERGISASGRFVLSAPRRQGSHADRFWAAALAVHAGEAGAGGRAECHVVAPIRFARRGVW